MLLRFCLCVLLFLFTIIGSKFFHFCTGIWLTPSFKSLLGQCGLLFCNVYCCAGIGCLSTLCSHWNGYDSGFTSLFA